MLSHAFDGEDPAAATTTAAAALAEQSPAVVNVNSSLSSNTAHPIMVPTNSNVTATTASSNVTISTTAAAPLPQGDDLHWTNGAESESDAGKRFLNVLLELCDAGLVYPGKKLKNTAIPASMLVNPSAMTHCLEVGDFCCDSADIDLVATYKEKNVENTQKVQAMNAGVRIEDAIFHKMFELLEKRPEELKKCPEEASSLAWERSSEHTELESRMQLR